MRVYYPLFLALFCCCCQLTVHANSSCPNVTGVTDFRINQVSGSWFVFEAQQSSLSPKLKCNALNFTVVNPRSTICIISAVQTSNGNPFTYTALLNIVGDAKKGQFVNDVIGGNYHKQFPINVLGLEENSFHVWYGCDSKTNVVQAFLVSKQRQVPDSVRSKCHDILRENNIDPSDFATIDQENCPN